MTKEQKVKFLKSEFQRFIKYFNLLDYEYWYKEENVDDCRAYISWFSYESKDDADGKGITFVWSKKWIESKEETTKYYISKVAFHEAIEVLLLPLRELAKSRNIVVTNREVGIENHRIVRILENTIFEKLLDKN